MSAVMTSYIPGGHGYWGCIRAAKIRSRVDQSDKEDIMVRIASDAEDMGERDVCAVAARLIPSLDGRSD